jgi:hypothetical protein
VSAGRLESTETSVASRILAQRNHRRPLAGATNTRTGRVQCPINIAPQQHLFNKSGRRVVSNLPKYQIELRAA